MGTQPTMCVTVVYDDMDAPDICTDGTKSVPHDKLCGIKPWKFIQSVLSIYRYYPEEK